jgi:hypothetical protein
MPHTLFSLSSVGLSSFLWSLQHPFSSRLFAPVAKVSLWYVLHVNDVVRDANNTFSSKQPEQRTLSVFTTIMLPILSLLVVFTFLTHLERVYPGQIFGQWTGRYVYFVQGILAETFFIMIALWLMAWAIRKLGNAMGAR